MKSTSVPVGSPAPGFALPDCGGVPICLDGISADRLLIVFFRGFWCESCQTQLARMRAEYQEIVDRGAEVIAISADSIERSRVGNQEIRLPFTVLCDPDRTVIARYGVLHEPEETGPGISRPSIFLLDRDLIVRYAYIGDRASDRPSLQTVLLALDSIA